MNRVTECQEKGNYHFITEYPNNQYIEKTVSYICYFNVSEGCRLERMGKIDVYMRNGERYSFPCWVTGYCGQFGISVSDDGRYVYLISDEKGLWCYTYKGEIVWKTRYTSVSHVFPHPNNYITCILTKKLAIIDTRGEIIQQVPVYQETLHRKVNDDVIAAHTSETIFALFDSMTLEILHRVSLKKLGLWRFYELKLDDHLLTIYGLSVHNRSEKVTLQIDLRTHPAVIK